MGRFGSRNGKKIMLKTLCWNIKLYDLVLTLLRSSERGPSLLYR